MMRYLLLTLLSIAIPVYATIIDVPTDFESIQAALDNSSAGDTVLVADGTYLENVHFPTHQVVLGSHFLIDGNTDHLESTIISSPEFGVGHTVFFDSGQDTTTVLAGFTIRDGEPGVRCYSASPMIRNNIITNNVRQQNTNLPGCGIAVDSSSAVIRDNHILNNTLGFPGAYPVGGGIGARHSSPRIERNLIEHNGWTSYLNTSLSGGGIGLFYSSGMILDNHILDNTAPESFGGGIYCNNSSPTLQGNLIEYNSARTGGGVFLGSSDQSILHENTIRYNEAFSRLGNGRGGGIAVLDGEPLLGTSRQRLNLYDNHANYGFDLHKGHYEESLTCFADTVTIGRADPRYYNREAGSFTLNAQAAHYTQLQQHGTVYVSPDGDDSNMGTSPETAVRSLGVASRLVPYDGMFPDTIRMMEGEYQFDETTLPEPLAVFAMLHVMGSGQGSTVIESSSSPVFRAEYSYAPILRGFTLRGVETGIEIRGSRVNIDSVEFDQCLTAIDGEQARGTITNCSFRNSGSAHQERGVLHVVDSDTLLLDFCLFENNLSTPLLATHDRTVTIRRTIFRNNIGAIRTDNYPTLMLFNCLIQNNSGPRPPLDFTSSERSEINNCTVVNNTPSSGEAGALFLGGIWLSTKVQNSIFWNNRVGEDATQIVCTSDDDTLEVTYSDIEGGYPGYQNLQVDPVFDNPNTYELASDSPLIDAGKFTTNFHDIEDPDNPGFALYPSQGTFQNDLGIYGGPSPLQPSEVFTSVGERESRNPAMIEDFRLHAPYPNPFNSQLLITFELHRSSRVRVQIFDLLGRQVAILADEVRFAGEHRLMFAPAQLASGVYIVRATTAEQSQTVKVVYLK